MKTRLHRSRRVGLGVLGVSLTLCISFGPQAQGQREASPSVLSTDVEVVSGPMDADAARAAVARVADRLARCAPEDARAQLPPGGATFDIRVRGDGATQALLARETFDQTMRRCLERTLFANRWPAGETGSRFSVRVSSERMDARIQALLDSGAPGLESTVERVSPASDDQEEVDGRGLPSTGPSGGNTRPLVQVVPGQPEVRGNLSREVIRQSMRRHIPAFRFCYERELRSNPDLAGRVSLRFVIGPNGRVSGSSIAESTVSDSRVGQCMLQRARHLSFPSPEGGGIVVVTFPFIFRTAPSEPEAETP